MEKFKQMEIFKIFLCFICNSLIAGFGNAWYKYLFELFHTVQENVFENVWLDCALFVQTAGTHMGICLYMCIYYIFTHNWQQ